MRPECRNDADLSRQVVALAERAIGSPAPAAAPSRRRAWRPPSSARSWLLPAISLVVAAAVVAVVVSAGPRARGHGAATTGAGTTQGLGGVRLGRHEAWYVTAAQQETIPWEPIAVQRALTRAGTPASTTVNSATRAAVVNRVEFRTWILKSGEGDGRAAMLGKPRFIGSPHARAVWRSEGSDPMIEIDAKTFATTNGHGFQFGDRMLSYARVASLPTSAPALLRFFPPTRTLPAANRFSEIATALGWVPLPEAVRRALFTTLARLPGVEHLGVVRDPLDRRGIALGIVIPGESAPRTGPGSGAGSTFPMRSELIFEQSTKALLATETVLLKASPVRGIGAGYAIQSTAYVGSSVVPAATVPKAAPLPRPRDPSAPHRR